MKIKWLSREGHRNLILFFNGWGMDERSVAHLQLEGSDLLMCNSYHLEGDSFPDLSGYETIYVVAWSMGVYVAQEKMRELQIIPSEAIAINGTGKPVDDRFGIPEAIFQGTNEGFSEKNRQRFMARILGGARALVQNSEVLPQRDLEEQHQELGFFLAKATQGEQASSLWTKVFLSEKDLIFPLDNMKAYWEGHSHVCLLSGPHYPFGQWKTWKELFNSPQIEE